MSRSQSTTILGGVGVGGHILTIFSAVFLMDFTSKHASTTDRGLRRNQRSMHAYVDNIVDAPSLNGDILWNNVLFHCPKCNYNGPPAVLTGDGKQARLEICNNCCKIEHQMRSADLVKKKKTVQVSYKLQQLLHSVLLGVVLLYIFLICPRHKKS